MSVKYFAKRQDSMKLNIIKAQKRRLPVICAAVLLLMFASCDVPVDRGVFNPINAAPDQLVTVKIAPNLAVSKVDNYQVHWTRPDNNYSQVVKISPGIHMFEISYNDGVTWTMQPIAAVAKFSPGNIYSISETINGASISIQIGYKKNGVEESALFNMNSLSENDGPLAVYVKYVFNPTLASSDGKVLLSNDDKEILFEHDLVYRMTDKKTGAKTEGRYAIEMDFTMGGRIYFLEADVNELSSEAFLNGAFRQEAQIIATPVTCDGNTVTFMYAKPENLAGEEDDYTITDLTPGKEGAEQN
jgi:hypothetical protein